MTIPMNETMRNVTTAEILLFLKGKIPVIHNSNIFYRDLYYGVMAFMESRGKKLSHADAERMTGELAARLTAEGILTKIDHQSWRLNYPQFALPRQAAPAPAAKAAPTAGAAQSSPAAAVSASPAAK